MKTYLITSYVKKYYHDHSKRISKKTLLALNAAVEELMLRSIILSRKFKTVSEGEVRIAYRQASGLEI